MQALLVQVIRVLLPPLYTRTHTHREAPDVHSAATRYASPVDGREVGGQGGEACQLSDLRWGAGVCTRSPLVLCALLSVAITRNLE